MKKKIFLVLFLATAVGLFSQEDKVWSLADCLEYAKENNIRLKSNFIKGDVNADSQFTIADLVMLEKFLLGAGTLTDWQAGDLCNDGKIDVFDMIEMRKMFVS
jgi:hypothetical protein